jgi:hypothetical protein
MSDVAGTNPMTGMRSSASRNASAMVAIFDVPSGKKGTVGECRRCIELGKVKEAHLGKHVHDALRAGSDLRKPDAAHYRQNQREMRYGEQKCKQDIRKILLIFNEFELLDAIVPRRLETKYS